jgi:hypothetical protein
MRAKPAVENGTPRSDVNTKHAARRLGPRPRKSRQCFNLFTAHRQLDRSPPSCHDAVHQQISRSMIGFMESVV